MPSGSHCGASNSDFNSVVPNSNLGKKEQKEAFNLHKLPRHVRKWPLTLLWYYAGKRCSCWCVHCGWVKPIFWLSVLLASANPFISFLIHAATSVFFLLLLPSLSLPLCASPPPGAEKMWISKDSVSSNFISGSNHGCLPPPSVTDEDSENVESRGREAVSGCFQTTTTKKTSQDALNERLLESAAGQWTSVTQSWWWCVSAVQDLSDGHWTNRYQAN